MTSTYATQTRPIDFSQYPDTLKLSLVDNVLTISLNNPDMRNAMLPEMDEALTRIFWDADRDRNVRVVVLTGEGKAFCAGGDIAGMQEGVNDMTPFVVGGKNGKRFMQAMLDCDKPIVARVQGDAVGATMYYGAGAGAMPTASAVVADLVDITRLHTADPGNRVPHLAFQADQLADTRVLPMDEVVTSYYLRMRVTDRPGVLADITRVLADGGLSIDAMVQKEPPAGEEQVDIIMLTHETREKQINVAIARIEALPVVTGKVTRIRLEELGRN